MSEWTGLAQWLVELDLAIEDLESWATSGKDIEELKRLEGLRDEVQYALSRHHVSERLCQKLEAARRNASSPVTIDPRD
jgi:hypothetical protein